ncbi:MULTISPECIES: AAA family ATPase [unclassified Mesorhizobium]|uniref:AAA family ATPase n=1 Tax=unclassified Mesorhizobium TaxID=325217 RepID=UPI001128E7BF|nr:MULTISPECIES: AAA family ATPase [unclassified Mesorhizobium]TPK96984.1 AAA family ATPase [Mesorhizobium sp. B2-4-16]TPL65003.1 AAA family ATPase [Mesorhizobium sp. B2-4-3]
MKNMSPRLRAKIVSRPARFLAYCSLMRALRGQRTFLQDGPGVFVLVVPQEDSVEFYEDACKFPAFGESLGGGFSANHERTDIVALKPAARGKRTAPYDLVDASVTKDRLLVVTTSRDLLAEGFDSFADAVLDIEPPDPRHVLAAARVCHGVQMAAEQAEVIAAAPLKAISAAWRKGRPFDRVLKMLNAATSPKTVGPVLDVARPYLDDLSGLGEAAEWGRELAIDLLDWKAGRIRWADVDKGILLSGPPGCGKTMFAKALAQTCGVHLVVGSLAQWQAQGHLGDLLKAMRGAFDEAKKNAPSIVFIDEIDSVGDRTRFSGDNATYSREVVNGLLECMDGATGREGVVVVGATNFPDMIDTAIRRPGRLDRHIRIPLPDAEARKGILSFHLGGKLEDSDRALVADRTEGWTGARLEQLVRDARRRARRARREISRNDLQSQLPELVTVPDAMLRRNAVHEAGHAVVGLVLGIGELVYVEIKDTFDPSGDEQQRGGGARFDRPFLAERTRQQFLDLIAIGLAGLAAEEVVLGQKGAGAGGAKGSDLHGATLLALQFEASYGLGSGLTYLSGTTDQELLVTLHMDGHLRKRVEGVLTAEFARAKSLLEAKRTELARIAENLFAKKRLLADEVRALAGIDASTARGIASRCALDCLIIDFGIGKTFPDFLLHS